MILRIFRDNQVFTFLITFLLAVSTWLFNILEAPQILISPDYYYPFSIFRVFPVLTAINEHPNLTAGINILLAFVSGFYLLVITIKYQVIQLRSSITMFLFLLLTIPYFQVNQGLSFPLVSLFFTLLVFDILFASLEKKFMTYRFFDSALIIAVLSMFNFYCIFFAFFILFIWLQFRRKYWREALLILFGILLPYAIMFVFLYIYGYDTKNWYSGDFKQIIQTEIIHFDPALKTLSGITIIVFLLSSVKIIRDYFKMKIITRRYSLTFLFLFLVVILIILLSPQTGFDILFFLSVPLSFLFAYYFTYCKANIYNQLLLLLLIAGNLVVLFH